MFPFFFFIRAALTTRHTSHVINLNKITSSFVALYPQLSCSSLRVLAYEARLSYSSLKVNIYRRQLSLGEVSLQEFPVWGPKPLTRSNLPFQMKAAVRETVLFGRAAEPCLQTAGMWDVWSGGQEARKECQLCPCLSRAGSPFSFQ